MTVIINVLNPRKDKEFAKKSRILIEKVDHDLHSNF